MLRNIALNKVKNKTDSNKDPDILLYENEKKQFELENCKKGNSKDQDKYTCSRQ